MQSTSRYSYITIWSLAMVPGVVALGFLTRGDFASAGATLNLLGRLTGIWGLALLLVAAMLCCRVPGFDRPFGGLTKLWQLHHRLGALAFLLLMAHPVLLALAAAEVSLAASVSTLFSRQPAVVWGWVALLALMVFMAPTFAFFGKPEYQRWKWLHRLSGITVVFALVHTLMLNRSLPGAWAGTIWGLFAVLTVAAIGYRWLISRWRGQQRYRVSKVDRPANNVVELNLITRGRHLVYEPGQFVYLRAYDPALASGRGEEHPYTLSSAPDEAVLRIAIKALGDSSRAIQGIAVDSEVSVEGPYGRFFPAPGHAQEPELWIAGGIGITPFLGRLRHLALRKETCDVCLIYCVQDEARVLFDEELSGLSAQLPGMRLKLHFFYREGPLQGAFIEAQCPDLRQRAAYICGPTPLIDLAKAQLLAAGVPTGNIVSEEFELM